MLDRTELRRIKIYANNRFPNRATVNILKLLKHIKHIQRQNSALREEILDMTRSSFGEGLAGW